MTLEKLFFEYEMMGYRSKQQQQHHQCLLDLAVDLTLDRQGELELVPCTLKESGRCVIQRAHWDSDDLFIVKDSQTRPSERQHNL